MNAIDHEPIHTARLGYTFIRPRYRKDRHLSSKRYETISPGRPGLQSPPVLHPYLIARSTYAAQGQLAEKAQIRERASIRDA